MSATISEVLASPCTSYWLRGALETALSRDSLDAARDAELMASLLRARCTELLGEVSLGGDTVASDFGDALITKMLGFIVRTASDAELKSEAFREIHAEVRARLVNGGGK